MKKISNIITLTNRKLSLVFDLSNEELDTILNDYADDLLYGRIYNDEHYICKITSREVGIIYNYQISESLYHVLRNYIDGENIVAIKKRDETSKRCTKKKKKSRYQPKKLYYTTADDVEKAQTEGCEIKYHKL